jgi:hypothetical protein
VDPRSGLDTEERGKIRIVFWDVLSCKIIVDRRFKGTCCLHDQGMIMIEAARTSESSVYNYFTRQYIPEDNSELHTRRRENLKSQRGKIISPLLGIEPQ